MFEYLQKPNVSAKDQTQFSSKPNHSKRSYPMQTKLKVSQPNDPYELEADRIAEQIIQMSDSAISPNNEKMVNRKCSRCQMKEDEEKISRKSSDSGGFEVSDETANDIDSMRGGGSQLDHITKQTMESRFGFDFSKVRIHTDEYAAKSAESVNALAYTMGYNIYFSTDQYNPNTYEGRKLIAHELSHTVQQTDNVQRKSSSSADKKEIETSEILAKKMHDALAGWGTDEDEVYRILKFSPTVVRAMINYYNDNYNDLTGKGLIEDIYDDFSGSELDTAMTLLANAHPEQDIEYKLTSVSPTVVGEPDKLWVGLIVRGKESKEHHPGVMEQHADVITPDIVSGTEKTVGYFGESGGPGISGSGTGQGIGLGMKGVSADFMWFLNNRPWYVDLELAMTMNVKSSLILVKVSKKQAEIITKYWEDLKNDPGTFNILGANCSTAADAGFEKAGITKEISGLDTPDHLFEQLREEYKDAYMISGYYGYKTGMKWDLSGGYPKLVDPGTGVWQGPFVAEKRLK